MKKCPYCGKEIRDDALHCKYCEGKKTAGTFFGRVMLVLVIAGVLYYGYTHPEKVKIWKGHTRSFFQDLRDLARDVSGPLFSGIKARTEQLMRK